MCISEILSLSLCVQAVKKCALPFHAILKVIGFIVKADCKMKSVATCETGGGWQSQWMNNKDLQ